MLRHSASGVLRYSGGGFTISWGYAIDANDARRMFNLGNHAIDAVKADSDGPNAGISHSALPMNAGVRP